MQPIIEQFRLSIDRIRILFGIYGFINAKTTNVLDSSDILRAAFVLAVSALDYYVHEVVRMGMLEIHRGERFEPSAFCRFQISLGNARQGLITSQNIDYWLEDEIRQRHSYKSFQQPDAIADAIRLISDKELWKEVSIKMGIPTKDIKQQLRLIVERRNKIAHEADIDPTYPGCFRWPINETSVKEAVDFIEQVVESIHQIL